MKQIEFHKAYVFGVTFFTYITYHCSRTVWSYIQKYMQQNIPLYGENMTGYANLSFLFTYGICMKIFGSYGSHMNLKYSISIGSFIAGLALMIMAFLGLNNDLNIYLVFTLMIINGAAQCTGWPCLISIMGNWYKGKNIGLLMGIWAGNSNVGDIIGLLIGDIIVQRLELSCYYGLIIAAIALWCNSLLILTIYASPEDVKQNQALDQVFVEEQNDTNDNIINQVRNSDSSNVESYTNQRSKITFFNAWLIPGVALYSIGYVCLKGTFLSFLFWLPNYFQGIPSLETQSSYISQMFDYGTFLGGIIIGILGDKYRMRAVFMVPSLLIASLFMLSIKYLLGTVALYYYLFVFGVGIFQGGPYNSISGAIVIELSNTPALSGNKMSTRLVSSIIEGTGTLGGALFQVVIPYFGKDQLFTIFTVVTLVGAFVTMFIMIKEFQRRKLEKCI